MKMTLSEKDVYVNIKSIQSTGNDKPSEVIVDTEAKLRKIENGYEIEYYEAPEENDMKFKTLITCIGEDYASIIKDGDISSTIIMETNKKNQSYYNTPFGSLVIGVFTEQIENNMSDNGGTLYFKYTVDFNSSLALRNDVTVTVSEHFKKEI